MASGARKADMTIEEFDAWAAAGRRSDAVTERADECGGPGLSLVPVVEQDVAWPTDLLPPGEQNDGEAPVAATPFDGVELPATRNRLAGWSADRQRYFLATLAETGSVHLAASAARLSARSAYKLRTRSPAFAAAWDTALQLAVGRLSAIVFDRAINGRIEQVFSEGELVAERRVPNDRLLTWLLARLDPSASPCRGSSAAMPTPRPKPSPASRRCSTRSTTKSPISARHCELCELSL